MSATARNTNDSRSIKVPGHRFAPIQKKWMEIYTPVVEQLNLEIRMNLKTRCVEIRVPAALRQKEKEQEDDRHKKGSAAPVTAAGNKTGASALRGAALMQKAAEFVKAVVLGYEVSDAMAVIRLDDIYIDSFEVKDVRYLHGDNLSRAIGRLSGSHGKTKFTIENVTRTRIVVADTHIHIMGATANIQAAKDAICDLIRGSPAAKVANRIRAAMNRINDPF